VLHGSYELACESWQKTTQHWTDGKTERAARRNTKRRHMNIATGVASQCCRWGENNLELTLGLHCRELLGHEELVLSGIDSPRSI